MPLDVFEDISTDRAIAATLELCRTDGLFWLSWVKTRDEADPQESVKTFPCHKPYVVALWNVFSSRQWVVVAKSRQMLVSWCVAAFCVWTARFTPHQSIYWQSKQYTDAIAMVSMPIGGYMGRCQFIEENLEPWMRVGAKFGEGLIQYPNGSMIRAVAGGADKIRGQVYSLYVGDEFAHQEDQAGVYATVSPLMQKGSKAFFVSTPNGSDNMFATLYHGRPVGTDKA